MSVDFDKLYGRYDREKDFKNHCSEKILKLAEKREIQTEDTLPEIMNSYERNMLMPLWDDALLIKNTKYFIEQSGREFCKTNKYSLDTSYNETIKHKLIFMLLERLEKKL